MNELTRGLRRNSNLPKLPVNSSVALIWSGLSLVAPHFARFTTSIFVKSPIVNAEEFLPRKRLFENTKCEGRNLFGCEMGSDEIVQDPVGIQASLQSRLVFGIGVGLAPITGHASSECTVEGLQMIGMNVCVFDILFCVRMFRFGCLILGSFASSFVGLRALVLQSDFHARLKRFLGRPTLPVCSTV